MRVYATVRTAASHTRNVFYGAEPITSLTFAVSNGQFDVLKSHIALCRYCNVGELMASLKPLQVSPLDSIHRIPSPNITAELRTPTRPKRIFLEYQAHVP